MLIAGWTRGRQREGSEQYGDAKCDGAVREEVCVCVCVRARARVSVFSRKK